VFYVYEHLRQDTNAVFYVGKGSGARCSTSQGRNRWWQGIAKKHGYTARIRFTVASEELAYLAEQELIDQYRRLGCQLVNMTDGGEGMTGHKMAPEVVERRAAKQRGIARPQTSAKMKGKQKSEEHRRNLSLAKKGIKASDAAKKKISETRKGRPSHMLGKTHLQETKIKIAEALKGEKNHFFGKTHTTQAIAKIIAANVGRKESAETRLKKSLIRRGEKNPNFGVRPPQDQIDRQRATLMARPRLTCYHCGKQTNEGNAKRWHFDNCKEKVG
jgi:hypothetical protein